MSNRDVGDGFFESRTGNNRLIYFDVTYTAGRRKKNEDGTHSAKKAREILMTYGNYDWLTSSGSFVILNNGIEFAATYFVMLLALIVLGGGRYVSVDYWLNHWIEKFHGEK